MPGRRIIPFAVGLVVLGVLGGISYVFFWDPQPTYRAAPNVAADAVGEDELAAVAAERVFFGHMSVGNNIISGMRELYRAHDVEAPQFVEVGVGEVPDGDGPAFVHALIGENRHPYRKLENFEAMMRGGMADRVDVAALKFCYSDIRWDTDVQRLFDEYRATMDRLEADYPQVRFVHLTAPLTTGPYGIKDHIKVVVGRNDNAARQKYNELMREAYGPDRLLDVAAVESQAPDGTPSAELYSGYSNDGAHLNESGSALVAAEFVRMLGAGRP
jgi:hypothetical protein